MSDTVVWISGASGGIGGALARTLPWEGVRLINLDHRAADGIETILFDLTRPESWTAIDAHFRETMADPQLRRAVFLHCGYAPIGKGVIAAVDPDAYAASLIANNAGVLAIAAAFFRHAREGLDSGLMVMSSGAAAARLPGYSIYGSAKAAVEQWVRVARAEVRRRGWGPWVVAMRPGLVRTPATAAAAALDPLLFPMGPAMARDLEQRGEEPEAVARRIWAQLPPEPARGALIDLDPAEDLTTPR